MRSSPFAVITKEYDGDHVLLEGGRALDKNYKDCNLGFYGPDCLYTMCDTTHFTQNDKIYDYCEDSQRCGSGKWCNYGGSNRGKCVSLPTSANKYENKKNFCNPYGPNYNCQGTSTQRRDAKC